MEEVVEEAVAEVVKAAVAPESAPGVAEESVAEASSAAYEKKRDGAATEDTKDQITISKVIALSSDQSKSNTNVLPLHQLKPLLPRRRMSHTRKRTSTLIGRKGN